MTAGGQHDPIGIFDSGIGGLSVLSAIHQRLPAENLFYIADSAYAPYGELTAAAVRRRSELIVQALLAQGVKAVVVACNTATALAVDYLRARYTLPMIAIEPALKPAIQRSSSGTVGVLATRATLSSARYAALLARYGDRAQVIAQPCPGLVEHIERGDWKSDELRALLQGYLSPLLAAGADQIVLGCTHYPFLRPLIETLAGVQVEILETGPAVAAELQRQLSQHGLLNDSGQGQLHFRTSGDPASASAVLKRLYGEDAVFTPL